MIELNVALVYDKEKKNILMCKRMSDPYKGKYNLVGGHMENGETKLAGAYRELEEETNITKNDIELEQLMTFEYPSIDVILYVFVGILNKEVELIEEKHPLHWIPKEENFFDLEKYAGEGNIGHMVKVYEKGKPKC